MPAINMFNDLTMEAVLATAVEKSSPLIVQTSVKTVKSIGYDVLYHGSCRQLSTSPRTVSLLSTPR